RNKSDGHLGAYARDAVAGSDLYQWRLREFALVDCYRTSRVKPASLGRIDRGRNVTFEPNSPALLSRHGHRYRGQQSMRVRMERAHENLLGVSFLDYLAQIHHGYAIGYVFDHGEVVRDEQIRKAELLLKLTEEIQYLRLYRNVESRYGFIAHDALGH